MSSEEEALAALMAEVGPVVAIGRPCDRLPPLGASRVYVVGDDWQTFVGDLIDKAALVLVIAGATSGLKWELEQCYKRVEPKRFFIIVPRDRKGYDFFRSPARRSHVLRFPPGKRSPEVVGAPAGGEASCGSTRLGVPIGSRLFAPLAGIGCQR